MEISKLTYNTMMLYEIFCCEFLLPIVRKIIAKEFLSCHVVVLLINKMVENSQIESSFANKIKLIGCVEAHPTDYSKMTCDQIGEYFG